MKYKIYKLIFFIINLLFQFSCKKFVSVPLAPNLIETSSLFSNDQTALSAVEGVYILMRNENPSLANGALSVYAGLSADEMYTTGNGDVSEFYNNKLVSTNSIVYDVFWSIAYKSIYRSNAIIAGLESSNGVTDSVKKQLIGEMEVVRSLNYFYLVNLFGDVPLIVSTDYRISSLSKRNSIDDVYDQIVKDLIDAETKLKQEYPSPGKVRPNLWTASALLARVYLFKKDYVNAEIESSKIINSNNYLLEPDLNNVFLINARETIWEIASPGEIIPNSEASQFIPYSSSIIPVYVVSGNLNSSFELYDARRASWIDSNIVNGTIYYYPHKYKNNAYGAPSEYDIVFRLAEQYLIRAEARAEQSEGVEAIVDLNAIRVRASLPKLSGNTLSQVQLLDAIAQERRIELFAEWGHRWLDLKRTGQADVVLGTEKPSWQSFKELYPIPYSELQYDVNLTQNFGY